MYYLLAQKYLTIGISVVALNLLLTMLAGATIQQAILVENRKSYGAYGLPLAILGAWTLLAWPIALGRLTLVLLGLVADKTWQELLNEKP